MFVQQKNKNESLSSTIVQPKLEIGKEDDEHEKEADSVANKVMCMKENTTGQMNSGAPAVQKMSTGSQKGIIAPPKVEKGINSGKGSGQSLPKDFQQEMGTKVRSDFSMVKIHDDNKSAEMNNEVGAKAFTHGNDIYFNQNQYNTSSTEGKHLLAHELTHTIQQGNSIKPTVQRKILLGGVDHPYSETFATGLSSLGLQIYKAMIASATAYEFTDEPALKTHIETEEKFRNALIDSAKNDEASCTFRAKIGTESPAWKSVDAYSEKDDMSVNPNYAIGLDETNGALPSEAIKSIFTSGSGSTFDCSAMMIANVYNAMLKTVGPDAFNKLYEGDKKKDLIISPEFVYFKDEKSGEFKDHPLLESGMYEKVTITSMEDLIPGDWVYFINSLAYKMIKGSGGAWMGEHATYTGITGEERMYKGFGIPEVKNYKQMQEEMAGACFREINPAYLAIWKAVEQWAPKDQRAAVFKTIANSGLAKFQPVEKQADGFKVSPDSYLTKVVSDAHKITIGAVVVPLTEFDPDNWILTEPDIEGDSLLGVLPGISKSDVLRPRVDKMK